MVETPAAQGADLEVEPCEDADPGGQGDHRLAHFVAGLVHSREYWFLDELIMRSAPSTGRI